MIKITFTSQFSCSKKSLEISIPTIELQPQHLPLKTPLINEYQQERSIQ